MPMEYWWTLGVTKLGLRKVVTRPRFVNGPRALPGGCWIPFGYGFERMFGIGVRFESFELISWVLRLKPCVWPWPVGFRKYLPYPARNTVLSLIWYAMPARAW